MNYYNIRGDLVALGDYRLDPPEIGGVEIDCPNCRGCGEIPCPDCNGDGHYEEWEYFEDGKRRVERYVCDECSPRGSGKIPCPECDGSGIVYGDEGDIAPWDEDPRDWYGE